MELSQESGPAGKSFADYYQEFKHPDWDDPRTFQEKQRDALSKMEQTAATLEDCIILYRAAMRDIWNPFYLSVCPPSVHPIADHKVAERALKKIKELGGGEPPR
jgi:hypothetical protein